jgi:hypothetical protein
VGGGKAVDVVERDRHGAPRQCATLPPERRVEPDQAVRAPLQPPGLDRQRLSRVGVVTVANDAYMERITSREGYRAGVAANTPRPS